MQCIDEVKKYWDWYNMESWGRTKAAGSRQSFEAIKADHDVAYAWANRSLGLMRLRGRKVLELGCGIGLDTVEFCRHGGEVTALDVSGCAVELTQRHLASCGVSATVEEGNAEDLRYDSDSFDCVIARGLLMFTPNDLRATEEIFRVLKPGGEAQILLHKRLSWYVLLAQLSRANLVHETRDPPVNRLYTMREARNLISCCSSHEIFLDRFPTISRRKGILAKLYNGMVVPHVQVIPERIIRAFGYYIVINALK